VEARAGLREGIDRDGRALELYRMDRFAFGEEVPFEIGLGIIRRKRAVIRGEAGFVASDSQHLAEVLGVVGFEEEFAAGLERFAEIGGEGGVEEAARVVAAFGPGIREQEVGGPDRGGAEEVTDGVGRFEPEDPDVGQGGACGSTAGFPDAAEQAFDAEEVALGELRGAREEERAFPRTEIDFDRGAAPECGREIKRFQNRLWLETEKLRVAHRFSGILGW